MVSKKVADVPHLLVSEPFNCFALIEKAEVLFRKSNPWKTEHSQAVASKLMSSLISH
jgi:hypothetical protein